MKLLYLTLLTLITISCLPTEGAKKSKKEIESDIDEFIEAVLECQNIPGINLAVVNDGEAYLSKGYGVKDLETMEPLTNKTLLVIASVTKQFVSAVVGLMLDETSGVTWNTPVRDVLGEWFYFNEGHRSERATIRDLLSHRMGMLGHNQMRIHGFTIREMMERIRFLEFVQEWRLSPIYHNLMYGVASYVAETLAGGTSWEDLARSRLFTPLGMDASTFVHQAKDRWDEFAKGYIMDDGQLREVSLEVTKAYYDTISAPGAVSTNAEDMTKWLMMLVNNGQNSDGDEVVPPGVLNDVHTPATVSGGDPSIMRPEYPVTYSSEKWALGWYEGYYRGFKKSSHGGSRDGYRSQLSILPDMNIGVFTSLNRDNSSPQDYIHMYIMDLLMDEEPWFDIDIVCGDQKTTRKARDTRKAGKEMKEENLKHSEVHSTKKDDKQQMRHPKDLKEHEKKHRKAAAADEDYIGVYGNYAYGNATVFINETSGLLSLSYGAAEWTLTETVADRFSAQGLDPFWYWTMPVDFDRTDDVVTDMFLPAFQPGDAPTFVRGRDMTTAPPPPELCD